MEAISESEITDWIADLLEICGLDKPYREKCRDAWEVMRKFHALSSRQNERRNDPKFNSLCRHLYEPFLVWRPGENDEWMMALIKDRINYYADPRFRPYIIMTQLEEARSRMKARHLYPDFQEEEPWELHIGYRKEKNHAVLRRNRRAEAKRLKEGG